MTDKMLNFTVDYGKLKIFDEFNSKDPKFPIVLSSPHAGSLFPKEFLENSALKENELKIVLHSPNENPFERPVLFDLKEENDTLYIK